MPLATTSSAATSARPRAGLGLTTPKMSSSAADDAGWEALDGQKYTGSKDPADHRHSSVRTAWMRRKRWALAACFGLLILLLAPVVVVRIVHVVLHVVDVVVPTGFKGPGACGELDSNGEHWVDRDLRLRHVGRSEKQRIFHGPVAWMGNQTLDKELGCPVNKCACFYRESDTAPSPSSRRRLQSAAVCRTQLKPIRMDKGRPWCLCDLHPEEWTARQADRPWQTSKTALLMGQTDKANPTHQANMHFFWIYHWMKQMDIKAGEMDMVFDCEDLTTCIGSFGVGLAQGLMKNVWTLPTLQGPLLFERMKFSVGGVFPMTIFKHQPEMPVQKPYVEMARLVASRHGVPTSSTFARPLKVTLAARQPGEERYLSNAEDLAKAMEAREFHVQTVTFGSLTFKQQIAAVADVAGLVGISGSDLVNAMFMPDGAALIEIFPLNRGVPIVNPELHNFGRMLGLTYARYTSPINATLLYDADGNVVGDALLRQIDQAVVDVPGCTAAVESAVLQAVFDQTDRVWLRFNTKEPITADRYAHPTLYDWIKPPRA
ncbi:hypothetical protein WJX74_009329 [Apatococcus lobatus]|uniref:Glycosyltransferase 61 catalytic domain-containing protein n=1 Tax=Apatococcus lobatus TaxID=904363 RepID=A0AAW1RQD9_9CHLO